LILILIKTSSQEYSNSANIRDEYQRVQL